MPEQEKNPQLELFRADIKRILAKASEYDQTAADVKNVNELYEGEMEKWELLKAILTGIRDVNIGGSEEEVRQYVDRLLTMAQSLLKSIAAAKVPAEREKFDQIGSRQNFLNWLANQNPINLLGDFLTGKQLVSSPKELKDFVQDQIADYLG